MNSKFHYNNKLRKKVIFFITTFILIILIFVTNNNRGIMSLGGNALGTVTSPVTKLVYVTTSKVGELFESVFGSAAMRREHGELITENKILKEKVTTMENIINREPYLKDEYGLITSSKHKFIKAYIAGKEPGNMFTRFEIDKGTANGVKTGAVVVQGVMDAKGTIIEGVVGKITETGLNWSKLSTIVDENSNISFRVVRTGDTGIINGQTNDGLKGSMYSNNGDVKAGDIVVTSGLGGAYPRDLYIGEVTSVKQESGDIVKKIAVKSPVDFSKLYRVLLLNDDKGANNE